MAKELEKNYNPSEIEGRLYQKWLDNKYFHAEVNRDKKPFTIVMPPPNITGQLHMGHALDNTLQDILIRFKRMQGYEALWVPGTDHASIATEAKIVEAMRKEGVTKEELGRDAFLKRAWDWKAEYGGRIVSQLKKIGSSADWDRERFTMDEGCSKAVKEVFVNLYNTHLPLMLDDRIPEERETAMQIGALMLDLCEVLIICGSCISEGMRREIQTAFEKGKDVYWYDSKMKSGELMKVENWRSIDDEVQIYT